MKMNNNKKKKKIIDYTQFKKKWKKGNKMKFNFKEVIIIMFFSLCIGFILCFSLASIIAGKNYFKVIKDLDKIVDTYYAIVDNYYGDLDSSSLVDGAVEGMISSVGDSFTSYSDATNTEVFRETINGSYEGIGCSIASYQDGSIVIVSVFDDSPSKKAGLEVGDIILKIDGESYEGKTSTDISNYVKDSGKDKIVLTIKRNEEEKDITINLSKVEIPYVTGDILELNDKKIGYINISLFASTTYKQFNKQLKKLEKESIDGLIIDVRSNSGGYLTSVTDICNLFLKKGSIIYQLKDSSGTIKKKDTTKEKRTYPVAVLINKESASASEILASAIKESYDDGIVVGTNSYGKGTVQQTRKLLDGSMIKYTTQNWLTPNGNFINEKGVTPTNVVELSEDYFISPSRENDNQLHEALKLLTTEKE